MEHVSVNYEKNLGKVKPMHAVNNGPAGKSVRKSCNNFNAFREAHIPYVRNHDASFFSGYGGEHTVDVHRIFENFDADPEKEENYDFRMTDSYLQDIQSVGAECFYRLGSRIEHEVKKVGTVPPKDFKKWAVICEHIIRHYNEGWANGFHMNIQYWEIWNEPDGVNDDGTAPNWQGTREEFKELFVITLEHLKKCFPNLKIGGPALTSAEPDDYINMLLDEVKLRGLTLDFFSYHYYLKTPQVFAQSAEKMRRVLDSKGFNNTEIIVNEWNYVKGWLGDDWHYTLKTERNLKGASFTAASMCTAHKSPMDMFMYYDARPCTMNGMFSETFYEPLKGYYPFQMFGDMYLMNNAAESESECGDIYSFAARSENEAGVMLTYYLDEDSAPEKDIDVDFSGLPANTRVKADVYILDENNDMELAKTEYFSCGSFTMYLKMKLFTTYYIKFSF